MPNNSAQQTANAQAGNQAKALQELQQAIAKNVGTWDTAFQTNPNPATQWGGIAPPSFAGQPSTIGGGSFGGSGGSSGFRNAFGPWNPSPQGGAAPSLVAMAGGGGRNGQTQGKGLKNPVSGWEGVSGGYPGGERGGGPARGHYGA